LLKSRDDAAVAISFLISILQHLSILVQLELFLEPCLIWYQKIIIPARERIWLQKIV